MELAAAVWLGPLLAAALTQFAASVGIVEVYVSATDMRGALVSGLTREDFEIREDGVLQPISTFVAEDFPLSIALAIDRSFSMKRAGLEAARGGALALLDALRPVDEAMIVAVGSQTEIVAPLSANRAEQVQAVAKLEVWGTTRLYDAIVAAIDHISSARGRRALVVLSDGEEQDSQTTAADVLARARHAGVLVYPVTVGPAVPDLFRWLAAVTGGRSVHPKAHRDIGPALQAIARELRRQYLIGYTPLRPLTDARGRWRRIEVSVRRPDVTLRTREGYYP